MLLDVCMPHLDGWGVLRSLREDGLEHVPVVMMAAARERLGSPAGAPAADAYVAKPFSLRDVVRMIRLCTDVPRARAREEARAS